MPSLALTATDAAAWAGLITAVGGVIVSIITALNGKKTEGRTDEMSGRMAAQTDRLNLHGEQINTLSLNSPPPPASLMPPQPPRDLPKP